MKRLISGVLFLAMVFCCTACGGNAEQKMNSSSEVASDKNLSKVFVAYFSATGTTKTLAILIPNSV